MQSVKLPGAYERGKVGIATVLFNSAAVLPDFFKSLHSQSYENFVVYAVDNASADASASLCEGQGMRFLVTRNKENAGFAKATNQGIRQALADRCEYILLLNNDVFFTGEFLHELVAGMERTGADLVAPLTLYFDRPDEIWAAGGVLQPMLGYRPTHLGMGEADRGQFSAERRIDFAPGSAILAKRDVFNRSGFLDEVYFTYWEDTDFAVRNLRAGLSTFLIPSAKLWHKVSSLTGKDSQFQRYYSVRNHALYIRKHCTPVLTALLTFAYLSVYGVMAMLRIGDPARVKYWIEGLKMASPGAE